MKKLIVLLLMILPLGAIAQEVKIAFVKTQEVFMAMPEVSGMEKQSTTFIVAHRISAVKNSDLIVPKEIFRLRSAARFIDRKYQVEKNARDSRYPRTYG